MSGVYVKGLGMPKDGEHPYWVTIHSDGMVEYNENKGQGWQTSEAIPVPDHGRLIDADALVGTYGRNAFTSNGDYAEGLRDVIFDVSIAPTIVPADKEADNG